MLLTYKFEVRVNNSLGIILGHLSYASSKLFNVGNYERKEYKSLGFDVMPNWYDQKKRLKDNMWYKSLPSQTSQEVLKRLNESWKSYLTLHYKWEKKYQHSKDEEKKNEPKSPYYKKDGYHSNVRYLSNSFKVMGDKIRFMIPKALKTHLKDKYQITNNFFYVKLKKSFDIIKQIEFSYVDKSTYKVYEIYEKEPKSLKKDNKHYIIIDIGIKNLLTVYDNNGSSFIVSSGSLMNTNYYFSKKIAYYQSIFDKSYPNHKKGVSTKRIKNLFELKNKRINLILHRASKIITDYCLTHNVSKVIIGDLSGLLSSEKVFANNKDKHRYNQNIRAISFKRIYDLLSYKLTMNGIELIKQSEEFTSSCSPESPYFSKEYVKRSNRKHRGLYKVGRNIYNADAIGAYNIMRKYRIENNLNDYFSTPLKGLSNPNRKYIPVTDQFLNEDYQNWNGKAGNVGISGRNYPDGNELIRIIHEYYSSFLQMLGNSIAE
ncbi:MAG: transposase [Bacilli bacterium]|nr:transposase [Bacilli bacterium]